MIWPNATDYNAAVQNPRLCFRDEDLRQGQAVGDLFGLPRPHSGNFADVYQIQGADGQNWAIKCFTRPVAGLRPRYQAISEHLRQTPRAFMVEFHFLDEGICISGQWYPLVKMRWVEGFRLNEFVREQLGKPVLLERLAQMWLRLAGELRDAQVAHGDLQHGNVLLVPGSKSSSLALKLIDYDGMFVPALADRPSGEVGHPNYQHPERLREGGYDRHMDLFAHLLIYTALRCLRVGGEELWQRHDNLENLLFREEDFRQPSKSRLLRELWDMKDRDSHSLVGHLLLASQGSLLEVPTLDELVDESVVRPLTGGAEARIDAILSGGRQPPESGVSRGADAPRSGVMNAVLVAERTATQPVALKASPPPLPVMRRTSAEIDLDTHPPAPATTAKKSFDAATLADPLVSILSRPAWLAVLGVIALISFLVVNVMVWSSVKQPATTPEVVQRPIQEKSDDAKRDEDKKDEKPSRLPGSAVPLPKQADKVKEDSPKLVAEPPPVRLNREKTADSVSVNIGKKGPLRVFLDRKGYRGEVEVRLTGLPAGVSADPVSASVSFATLDIEADEQTEKGEYAVKLLVRVGEQTVDESDITLVLRRLPGRQERVSFQTLDHMQLIGTLYHGWKRKKGMCVLMLHDLDRNRNTSGWKRLAETLQAEGHTVLTFDFRGCGESTKVSAAFWKYPVSKFLPTHLTLLSPEKQPKKLEADSLPGWYMPWLIHDIAAARTYLDVRHDDENGPVNTFNLVVIGAGQASALGSLWLTSEGLRFYAAEVRGETRLLQPEKLSVLQAVWIGMSEKLKDQSFAVGKWISWENAEPLVPVTPVTFIYGARDRESGVFLQPHIQRKRAPPRFSPMRFFRASGYSTRTPPPPSKSSNSS